MIMIVREKRNEEGSGIIDRVKYKTVRSKERAGKGS
jgi:hypothetical protein